MSPVEEKWRFILKGKRVSEVERAVIAIIATITVTGVGIVLMLGVISNQIKNVLELLR